MNQSNGRSSKIVIAILSALIVAGAGGLGSMLLGYSMGLGDIVDRHVALPGHPVMMQQYQAVAKDIDDLAIMGEMRSKSLQDVKEQQAVLTQRVNQISEDMKEVKGGVRELLAR